MDGERVVEAAHFALEASQDTLAREGISKYLAKNVNLQISKILLIKSNARWIRSHHAVEWRIQASLTIKGPVGSHTPMATL